MVLMSLLLRVYYSDIGIVQQLMLLLLRLEVEVQANFLKLAIPSTSGRKTY